MWRRLVCSSLGAVVLLACGPTGYDRATYELDSVAGVLFSNSLVVSRKVLPVRTSAGLSVTYPLLFQNHGSEAASLAVGEATAKLDGQPARVVVRCGEHNYLPSATLSLQPGERIRVDCLLTLTQAGLETARSGDTEVELDVPVLSEGRLQSASFTYRLRLEDAS